MIKYAIKQIESVKGIATMNSFLKTVFKAVIFPKIIKYLCINGALPSSGINEAAISPKIIERLNSVSYEINEREVTKFVLNDVFLIVITYEAGIIKKKTKNWNTSTEMIPRNHPKIE